MGVVFVILGSIAYWYIAIGMIVGYHFLITGDESMGFTWRHHGFAGKLAVIFFPILIVGVVLLYIWMIGGVLSGWN